MNGAEFSPIAVRRILRQSLDLAGIRVSGNSLELTLEFLVPMLRKMVYDVLTREREEASKERETLPPGMRVTPGERAVIYLMCQGRSVQEIAQDLNTPMETVRSRQRTIYTKWRVHTAIQVVLIAVRTRMVEPEHLMLHKELCST